MYIGWANNVNKEILDSTTVSVGAGAAVEDTLESGGQKKRRATSANPPDKYNVTMAFNCVDKNLTPDGGIVNDGLTELERFYAWYKHVHCFGTNPFIFPAILINSNRKYGEAQDDVEHIIRRIENGDPTARLPDNEYYIITSAVEGSKSGHHQQITMTWETYATGVYAIPDDTSEIQRIEAENGCVTITLTSIPQTEPTIDTWNLTISKDAGTPVEETKIAFTFDGNVTAKIYFTPKTASGIYQAFVGNAVSNIFEVD